VDKRGFETYEKKMDYNQALLDISKKDERPVILVVLLKLEIGKVH